MKLCRTLLVWGLLCMWLPVMAAESPAADPPATNTAAPAEDAPSLRLPKLEWTLGTNHHLGLAGWIVTDLVSFPRHESGFDTSWHSTFNLRAARISLRYGYGKSLSLRLDVEASTSAVEMQEAWFQYAPFDELQLRIGRQRVPFGLAQNNLPA